MKKILLMAAMVTAASWAFAQQKNFWTKTNEPPSEKRIATSRAKPSSYQICSLDLSGCRSELQRAPEREAASGRSNLIMSFPNGNGDVERFRIVEASVLHPDLAAKYPGIKSYAGQGLDDPTAVIRFSVSNQLGFHGMILSGEKNTCFIDPYST